MTVPSQTPRNLSAAAPGAAAFPYDFKILDASHLLVQVDGVTKTLNVDYTIDGVGNDAGGTVTFATPLVGGETVLRKRNMPFSRSTDYQHLGDFGSATMNNDQDAPVMMVQQVAADTSLALRLPEDTTASAALPVPVPNYALRWSFDGKAIEYFDWTGGWGSPGGASGIGFIQSGTGAVARTMQGKARAHFTVNDFGGVADNATSNTAAFLSAKAETGSGVATFEQDKGKASTYKFNTLGNSDLDNMVLDVPDGMTLAFPSSAYAPLRNVRFARQTRIQWTDINCDYYPPARSAKQRDKAQFIGAGDLRRQKLSTVAASGLRFLKLAINTDDNFSVDTPSYADANSYSYNSATPIGFWYGGFIQLRRGETYTVAVSKTGTAALGVMMRHGGGYSVLYSDPAAPSTAMMWRGIKAAGGAIATAQDVEFPGRGSYASYDPSRALWGITITDNGQAVITLNGRAVTAPVWTTALTGDIYEVGFVFQPTVLGATGAFYDPMIERNTDPLGRSELTEVRIFGDSTSDYLVGMWQDDFKDMLDHTFGVKLGAIGNYAVSGTNSFDALNSINTNGLGNAYYVVVGIGTNDIQSGSPLATTSSNISGIISAIQSAGRVPVIVLPYMWYGQTQAGSVRGQAATNYDAGAPYRARIARLCADTGAVLVDPTRELPEPKPAYLITDTTQDPLVRDNIHQSYLGYKLYAWAIARAIASHMARLGGFNDYRMAIPSDWMRNGWTLGTNLKLCITEEGLVSLQGNIGAGTAANGTVVMNLPRWARPEVQQSFIVWTNVGPGEIRVSTNGDVTIDNVGSPFATVHLGSVRFYAI